MPGLVLLLIAVAACAAVASSIVAYQVFLRVRGMEESGFRAFDRTLACLKEDIDRVERSTRDDVARIREQSAADALSQRCEVRDLLAWTAAAQMQQADAARRESSEMSRQLRAEVTTSLKSFNDRLSLGLSDAARTQAAQMEALTARLSELRSSNEQRLEKMRDAVDQRLLLIQQQNAAKLDEMRQTVDEKLQSTLEKRLGESFHLVSQRLEQVHKGLGEMQSLAAGVGDLKKVLTNVKARGTWGEVQLGSLLAQVMSPDRYDKNVAVTGTNERVEFAIRLPGSEHGPVWLPIDAKFPHEDYARLVEASEAGDVAAVEAASRALEMTIRRNARDIRDKYIQTPRTTDFAVLFLPTEGLYAEVLRRPGLSEALQTEYRVMVAGPTTLCAMLNSLQVGFQTLAIQEHASTVWTLLGEVKSEFDKFTGVLEKVKRKLQEASNTVDQVAVRTRVMRRRLRSVDNGDVLEPFELESDIAQLPLVRAAGDE